MSKPSTETEETVWRFFGALGAGDFAAAREALHPDAVWRVMVTGVPGEGVHRGPDAIFGFIGPIRALFEPGDPQMELRSTAVNGSLMVIESRGFGRFRDGRPYDNNYVMILEVKDGLVTELREYMDSHYVHGLGLEAG